MTEVRALGELEPADALIVIAFPSTGAASPIAGQYLIQNLDMPLVGEVQVDELDGLMHIHDGFPTTPIRIHGGDVACEINGPCRRTYMVSTEVQIPMPLIAPIARLILDWAKDARLILTLDAVSRDEGDDEPDVYTIASGPAAQKMLAASKAPALKAGLMTGMTAAILGAARNDGRNAGTLIVEARADHPDGRAAAALIAAMDPLIPQIKIDAEPLMRDALELETQIKQAMQAAKAGSEPARAGHTFI